ncbi:unnamed protein product, partial [Symbiodinium microadriaticum]
PKQKAEKEKPDDAPKQKTEKEARQGTQAKGREGEARQGTQAKDREGEARQGTQAKAEKEIVRKEGDIWWCEDLGRACRQLKKGIDMSGHPTVRDGSVFVVFEDGTEFMPPLIPADVEGGKFAASSSLPKKQAKAKAKAKQASSTKPVEDFVLPTIRAKFAKQGSSPPIIKVEARSDRHDLSSAWRQRFQIVIRGEMTAIEAMNICATFCDCYEHMNLNQGELNFRECRDLLIEMGKNGTHNFATGKMDWEEVAKQTHEAFPPKPTILYLLQDIRCAKPERALAPHEQESLAEDDDDDDEEQPR